MAKAQAAEKATVEIPEHLRVDFDNVQGEEFGGSSEILRLKENEAAGPLTYVGCRKDVDLGNNMGAADIHEAKDAEGDTWRLPIASNFRRQAETANLNRDDVFLIKRLPNAIKMHGAGKGNPMEMYAVKVTKRAPAVAAA